jgi:hypothetical protein
MAFNFDDYASVAERVALFWVACPDGRIITECTADDGKRVVFKALVYRHRDDADATATGYAEELRAERGINATSCYEVTETSAVGRALANYRFTASKKNLRPSREEMQTAQAAANRIALDEQHRQTIKIRVGELGYTPDEARVLIESVAGPGAKLAKLKTADLVNVIAEINKMAGVS